MATKITFNEVVKHGKKEFVPNTVYEVSDEAAAYFIAAGWAKTSTAKATVTVQPGEVAVDPSTVWGSGPDRGKRVLGK